MSFNVLAAACEHIAAKTGMPCSTQVPVTRPAEFVTVERTGGSYQLGRDVANLAVQCWAGSDYEAYTLALAVREAVCGMREAIPQVCKVEAASLYEYGDVESGTPRYQLDAYVTTRP